MSNQALKKVASVAVLGKGLSWLQWLLVILTATARLEETRRH